MAFIVFPDPIMGIILIIFLQIDGPVTVQLFQCFYLFCFCLIKELRYDLVELLDLSFGFPACHRRQRDAYGKLSQ